MIVLPHLNAVLAGMGACQFMGMVLPSAWMPVDTLDQLIAEMPARLAEAWATFASFNEAYRANPGEPASHQQIILVGWSASLQKMRAVSYEQTNPQRGFVEQEILGRFCAPWAPEFADIAPGDIMQLVRRQVEHIRRERPNDAAGGALIMAHVTRRSVTTSTAALNRISTLH
jgi:hypothetical protein